MPRVRRGRREDLEDIVRLELECFTSPYPPAFISYMLKSSTHTLLVCEVSGVTVGYAAGRIEGSRGHLLSICVSKRHRRRGLGRMLLKAMEEELKKKGAEEVYLEVREDNHAALSLYASAGYRQAGRIPWYYEDGCPAIVMRKSLKRMQAEPPQPPQADRLPPHLA
ncbi:MAG: ribosomal-protein-alanine N-acetyltransferase [Thermoproteota archaeon]|nr:MAG: ribosomal-protein-alanine N-acetyltransferase [Candidatus Korarchaeota archaeon]